MNEVSFGIFSAIVLLLFMLYRRSTKNYNYWLDRSVVGPKPIFFFGNTAKLIFGKITTADFIKNIYDAYPDEVAVGIFARSTPILILKDPEMIQEVLIKSFDNFADRGVKIYEDIDPLSQHLILKDPGRWKLLRSKLSPSFTSRKLKIMFSLVDECLKKFKSHLEKLAEIGEPVEYRDITAKFTTDSIGVIVFGLCTNGLEDHTKEYQRSLENSCLNKSRFDLKLLSYWMNRLLKPVARDERIKYFIHTLKDTINYREANNLRINDLVDLLTNIIDSPEQSEKLTDMLLAAQVYVFFVAGFETSSSTISNALYELAFNPDIQAKLLSEINSTIKKYGVLTFDSFENLKYLEKVVKETLRVYPPAYLLPRISMNNYKFSNGKISITRGTKVIIPVYPIHQDPKFYSDPERFQPERFDESNLQNRQSINYLPFGAGSRNCVGKYFAKIHIKRAIATAIQNFKFEVFEDEKYNKNGLYLKIKKI